MEGIGSIQSLHYSGGPLGQNILPDRDSCYDRDSGPNHIAHSPNCSIARAARLIDYRPRYSSLEAVKEAVDWLIEHGQVRV